MICCTRSGQAKYLSEATLTDGARVLINTGLGQARAGTGTQVGSWTMAQWDLRCSFLSALQLVPGLAGVVVKHLYSFKGVFVQILAHQVEFG